MSNKILSIGIAGYGTVGKIRHRFINHHPSMQTVAVCDDRFQDNYESDGVKYYNNYKELLDNASIDILFVCLPNYLAAEVTIAALENSLHVFCEKPPGKDINDIKTVMECEKLFPKQKLMYGFNHRHHDSVLDAIKIIKSNELGKVLSLRGVYGKSKIISFDSDWRTKRNMAGGGILLDQGIHMIDMMRMFAGEFTEIHSYVTNDYWNHDVEDNAYTLMKTEDGVIAMMHSSATQWRHMFQLSINLSKGAVNLSGILTSTKSYAPETITVIYAGDNAESGPREETTKYNKDKSWYREIVEFADVIINDKPVTNGSSIEALKTMELIYNIYKADSNWSKMYNIS